MARSIAVIQAQIIAAIKGVPTTYNPPLYDPNNTDPTKRGLTSTSQVAIWLQWTYVVAVAINLFEQVMDAFTTDVENRISRAAPGSPAWLQEQIFLFQYSATNPQIVQFDVNNFTISYPVVNPAYRIVTQCVVYTQPNKVVKIKVAANSTPLSGPQLAALTSYLNYINFAGVYFSLISAAADFLMVGADLYYDGQYATTIQADTANAINAFLATSNVNNFNGLVYLSELEDILQKVPGMKDVVLKQIEARSSVTPPASAVVLVNNYAEFRRNYQPFSGYMIVDTASGRDLASTLNFIVQ